MKPKRYSEEQILYALRQAESGEKVVDICRKLGVSEQTFYTWRRKYAEMGVSELRELDQLGRSLVHLVRLMEDFRRCGIELVSFSERLDFTMPTGKLLFQIISAFAEFERDCIRERVRAGMRNAKAKDKRIERPPCTYLSQEARKNIAEAYRRGEGSLRQLAAKHGTTASMAQRRVAAC